MHIFLDASVIDQSNVHAWQYLSCYLSACEQRELDQRGYRLELHRSQYIFGRLLLKRILCCEMNLDFESIDILPSSTGKPLLFLRGCLVETIDLSIAHYGYTIFVSVGSKCRCGVDVQSIVNIDWDAVDRVMGWSVSNERQWFGISFDSGCDSYLAPQVRGGLIWSGYEAWLKLFQCKLSYTEFCWHHISLLETDSVTHSQIFEMVLEHHSYYNQSRILLKLCSDEVFAVATHAS